MSIEFHTLTIAEVIDAMGLHQNLTVSWQQQNHQALRLQERVAERGSLISAITKAIRQALQMAALAARPDAVLIGALAETIDGSGRRVRPANYVSLVRPSQMAPFSHCSIIFRKEAFDAIGGGQTARAR